MKTPKNKLCLYMGCHSLTTHEDIVLTEEGDYVYTICCQFHAGPEAEPFDETGESKLHA